MYWKWQFEQDRDEEDTALGNAENQDDLTYIVKIRTLAVENLASDENGAGTDKNNAGINNILDRVKTGDTAELAMWAGILALSAGVILLLIIWKKKREAQEE